MQYFATMKNEWIKKRLVSLDKTQTGLGNLLGLSSTQVWRILHGKRQIKATELPKMASFLEMSETDVISKLGGKDPGQGGMALREEPAAFKAGPPPASFTPSDAPKMKIPVLGTALGGPDGFSVDAGQIVEYVPAPQYLDGVFDAYAVYVAGTSMMPRFKPGEILFVHPHLPPSKGDDVIVQLQSNGDIHGLVKTYKGRNTTHTICEQYDPAETLTFKNDKVKSIHVVVGTKFRR